VLSPPAGERSSPIQANELKRVIVIIKSNQMRIKARFALAGFASNGQASRRPEGESRGQGVRAGRAGRASSDTNDLLKLRLVALAAGGPPPPADKQFDELNRANYSICVCLGKFGVISGGLCLNGLGGSGQTGMRQLDDRLDVCCRV
jgi:hypothetical protein